LEGFSVPLCPPTPGYAGTIYKGQGRMRDQTYLSHSKHMHSASSYVAMPRHREHTTVFVAQETAADMRQLARQMARVDDGRAATQLNHNEIINERAQPSATRRQPNDERQRKIDEIIQRMKEQREREREDRERDR
jgi:hypothetical protein